MNENINEEIKTYEPILKVEQPVENVIQEPVITNVEQPTESVQTVEQKENIAPVETIEQTPVTEPIQEVIAPVTTEPVIEQPTESVQTVEQVQNISPVETIEQTPVTEPIQEVIAPVTTEPVIEQPTESVQTVEQKENLAPVQVTEQVTTPVIEPATEVPNQVPVQNQEQVQNIDPFQEIKQEEVFNQPSVNNNVNIMEDMEDDFNNIPVETKETNFSLLNQYAENISKREYVTNPAIGRDDEIRQLILILLTPEKSGILVGKPGIGKTAIVEGLGYAIQNNNVPEALKGYSIYKLNTASLLGNMPNTNEPKITVLLQEIKSSEKIILFIDEIHTLMGTGGDSLDFANIFKPGLDRGNIKIIGATTTEEYERYVLRDKAFVRRFQKVEVLEPTREHTIKILMGTMPKFEKKMNVKMSYTPFIQEKIMAFIVDLTSEYRRVYEYSVRYPDIALTILQQAFSYALFNNQQLVTIRDIKTAIKNTNLVYPDVIKKELIRFNQEFYDIYKTETIQRLKEE